MKKIILLFAIVPSILCAQSIKEHENIERSRDHHKFQLKIKYIDGKEETIKSELYDNPYKHSMLLYDAATDREIYPEETEFVELLTYPYFKGFSKDSNWLFRSHEGEINVYSIFPEVKLKYADFIQKIDGPMIPYSKKALLTMIDSDPFGHKEIKTARALDHWGKFLAFSGLASLSAGLIMADPNTSPYLIGAGATMIGVSLPLEMFAHDKQEHAVDVYNGHHALK